MYGTSKFVWKLLIFSYLVVQQKGTFKDILRARYYLLYLNSIPTLPKLSDFVSLFLYLLIFYLYLLVSLFANFLSFSISLSIC